MATSTRVPGHGSSRSNGALRILHISDLHERAAFPGMPKGRDALLEWDAEERGLILGPQFMDSLRELATPGIDLVCFTGDLADFGHPNEYDSATARIDAVLKAVNVPRSRFYAVPGNHDVQRKVAEGSWREIVDWLANDGEPARLGRWLRRVDRAPVGLSDDHRSKVLERTAAFWNWLRTFRGDSIGPTGNTLLGYREVFAAGAFGGVNMAVNLVGLDSAWLSGGEADQGKRHPNDHTSTQGRRGLRAAHRPREAPPGHRTKFNARHRGCCCLRRLRVGLENKRLHTDERLQSAGFADLLLALAGEPRDVTQTCEPRRTSNEQSEMTGSSLSS